MPVPASITQLIQSSGNSFHSKVARWFQSNGWYAQVSPYYMDQTQSKARELDLVVEKAWPITDHIRQRKGSVVVRLFVECKFIGSEAVFWFTPKNKVAAMKLVCSLEPFRSNNTYTNDHHYISGTPRVAKLFCSSNARNQETEPFYKALNQSLNATVAMRGRPSTHPEVSAGQGRTIVLNYPVVVCSSFSQLYAADFFSDAEPEAIQSNFQLDVQYAYFDQEGRPQDEMFLLDFVEFQQLATFDKSITSEAEAGVLLASD